MQAYSNPKRANDPWSLPDVEVFYVRKNSQRGLVDAEGKDLPAGYYYWFCFPGCMPDSDPIGPFASEELALADAQSQSYEESED